MTNRQQLSIRELSQELGVSAQQIRNYQDKGMPCDKVGKAWTFDLDVAKAWIMDNIGKKDETVEDAKARKMSADASLAELRLSKARGEVITSSLALELIKDEYAKLRVRLLSVASAVAPHLYVQDLLERQTIVDEAIRTALEELTIDTKHAKELADLITDDNTWMTPETVS